MPSPNYPFAPGLTIPNTDPAGSVNATDLMWIWQSGRLLRASISQLGSAIGSQPGGLNGQIQFNNNGVLGGLTNSAAFNQISPMTAAGDIIYGGASGAGTRLGKPPGANPLIGGTAPSYGIGVTYSGSGTNLQVAAQNVGDVPLEIKGIGSNTGNYLNISSSTGTGDVLQVLSNSRILLPQVAYSVGSPQLAYQGNQGHGFSWTASGIFTSVSGASVLGFTTSYLIASSGMVIGFSPSGADSAAPDTAVSRTGAGALAIGNGTAGNSSGTLGAGVININTRSTFTVTPPTLTFEGDSNGWYSPFSGQWWFGSQSSAYFRLTNNTVQASSDTTIGWNASNNTAGFAGLNDTGLSRVAAGTVAIGNGSNGDASGLLESGGITSSVINFQFTVNGGAFSISRENIITGALTINAPFRAKILMPDAGNNNDTGISRTAAGTFAFGNATQGDVSGTIFCQNITMGATSEITTSSGDMIIQPAGSLDLSSNSSFQFQIDTSGRFKPVSDNTNDIGVTGTNRIRNGFFAGTVEMGTLRIDQTPAAITHTVSISAAADSTTNFGHVLSVNMNGTTYWIPCGTVQP